MLSTLRIFVVEENENFKQPIASLFSELNEAIRPSQRKISP